MLLDRIRFEQQMTSSICQPTISFRDRIHLNRHFTVLSDTYLALFCKLMIGPLWSLSCSNWSSKRMLCRRWLASLRRGSTYRSRLLTRSRIIEYCRGFVHTYVGQYNETVWVSTVENTVIRYIYLSFFKQIVWYVSFAEPEVAIPGLLWPKAWPFKSAHRCH